MDRTVEAEGDSQGTDVVSASDDEDCADRGRDRTKRGVGTGGEAALSWRERARFVCALWRYMLPLGLVYFSEYAMQARSPPTVPLPEQHPRTWLGGNSGRRGYVCLQRAVPSLLARLEMGVRWTGSPTFAGARMKKCWMLLLIVSVLCVQVYFLFMWFWVESDASFPFSAVPHAGIFGG